MGDEHWMLYVNVESLNSTPELMLYCVLTNWNLNKYLEKKYG